MYCTLGDLRLRLPENRLVELTDDTHAAGDGAVQPAVVDRAIQAAGELIDSYLGRRYQLPLAVVPPVVRQIAEDLALYNLYDRATEMSPTEGMVARRRAAIAFLEQASRGEVALGLPEAAAAPSSLGAFVSSGEAIFTFPVMQSLGGFP